MKDGGSAFPEIISDKDKKGQYDTYSYGGITLRDYFAATALAGLCAKESWDDGEENVLANWAYDLADAMLAKRRKKHGN